MADIDETAAANRRGEALLARHPHAVSARFVGGKIKVELSNGVDFAYPPQIAQGLEGAATEDLRVIEVSPSGLGLHFPRLDADLYVPALLEGIFGSKSWMAARLGQAGGSVTSEAKAAASRENGRRGGRPRKDEAPSTSRRTGT